MLDGILLKKIIQDKKFYIFLLILLVGIFFRTYNFSDWLHFEIDQTYDIRLVSPAAENGILNLPLLGPTAGGGRNLRLGPAAYYLEYASAKIFGNTPQGHASLILVLSILSLPLFYLVCRRYFSSTLSLGLFAIFSISSYLILYSRFSWSPNYLPFFSLLLFLSLLKSVSADEKNRDRWFLFFVSVFAIITQIHFNAFFVIPVVAVLFLILKHPRFKLRTWIFSLFIFILVYSPLIISDIYSKGENFRFFLEKIGINSENSVEKSKPLKLEKVGSKLLENYRYNALEYWLIISGKDSINTSRFARESFGLLCKSCRDDFTVRLSGYLLFLAFFAVIIFNLLKEKDKNRKDFIILSFLFLCVSFLYYFYISYDGYNIYPRFFLLISPLAIILLGFLLEKIRPEKNKILLGIFLLVIVCLSFSNVARLQQYFSNLKKTNNEKIKVETEDIFPNNARITLSQQKEIVDFMKEKYNQNKYPVYVKSIHEYTPIFWYFLDRNYIPNNEISDTDLYARGNYFLTLPTYKLSDKDLEKYREKFDFIEEKSFGSLISFYISPKSQFITASVEDLENKKPTLQAKQVSEILTWKELFFGKK